MVQVGDMSEAPRKSFNSTLMHVAASECLFFLRSALTETQKKTIEGENYFTLGNIIIIVCIIHIQPCHASTHLLCRQE